MWLVQRGHVKIKNQSERRDSPKTCSLVRSSLHSFTSESFPTSGLGPGPFPVVLAAIETGPQLDIDEDEDEAVLLENEDDDEVKNPK